MKCHLLYRDRDLDTDGKPVWNSDALTRDLELGSLFDAMAGQDKFIRKVVSAMLLSQPDHDPGSIRYRQNALEDCLRNRDFLDDIYTLACEAVESERRHYLGGLSNHPSWVLHRSIDALETFLPYLQKLRTLTDRHAASFTSDAFQTFFRTITDNLDGPYFSRVQHHLKQLRFRDGVLLSARLGPGNTGTDYVLLRTLRPQRNRFIRWLLRLLRRHPPGLRYELNPRDESGAQALSRIHDRGINLAANALAQSADHVLAFFRALKTEFAFYVGCVALHDRLVAKHEPIIFPEPAVQEQTSLRFEGLYDVSLTLHLPARVVGNDLNADHKSLLVVTGANTGGKSTFLRSLGLAQLMMQTGMFVGARSFSANVCDSIATHYKREEDRAMESGKLDEELARMSEIAEHITPRSLILFNESFAATNDREGSEISRQIVTALGEAGCKIYAVTHLYGFAHHMFEAARNNAVFLRAERGDQGQRPFRIQPGEPLATSYGNDLYREVFDGDASFPQPEGRAMEPAE